MRYRLRTLGRLTLATVMSLCCLYLPFAWVAFVYTRGWTLDAIAVLTLPGHFVASQFMGGQAYDFYAVAALITVGLLSLGVYVGRRDLYSLALANLTLLSWSVFVSQWLWHRFDWLTSRLRI